MPKRRNVACREELTDFGIAQLTPLQIIGEGHIGGHVGMMLGSSRVCNGWKADTGVGYECPVNGWLNYLAQERADKLNRLDVLTSRCARLHMTADGVTRDITDEQIAKLREDIAEIEEILREEGCSFPED
jgi:hypothetical protein